ncbi:MAG: hypothetical protein K2X48_15990 [Chitinophagaceae bacterium]|nr:hypothetical protein [Chitinophagaceae bacterium]
MALNDIQFSGQQLSELFTDQLTILSINAAKASVAENTIQKPGKKPVSFKGKNRKGMLWVVHQPDQAFLSDNDFEFLSQIITACKMNMDDIALVNIAAEKTPITEIVNELSPKTIILCGIEYQQLPFKLDEYIITPNNNCDYFLCDELSDLRNDKAKKTKLWLALKALLQL